MLYRHYFLMGSINYSASTGELSVTSVLTATTDIASMPELLGSSLSFSALFTAVETPNAFITRGLFDSAAISVIDGDFNSLLIGELSSLAMLGRNGKSSARLLGLVNATDGSLAAMFGAGDLTALVFNLSPVFSATMFDDDFTGRVDGRIEGEAVAVPEPGILALLGIGVALIGFPKLRFKADLIKTI